MSTKIFVGSLPAGTKPEELRHLFEGFGVVTECDVMNRCGFVHMEKPEMAANAIKALNSTDFKGETINVEPGRVRDRNQKPGGTAKAVVGGGGGPRQRGPRMPNGMMRMQDFGDIDPEAMGFDGIDEKTTKDALQLCSAVFEEMNKLLNPNQMGRSGPRRGGDIGFPPNFVEEQMQMGGGPRGPRGPPMRGPRNNRNGPFPNEGPFPGPPAPVKGPRGPPVNRGTKPSIPKPGPQARGPNQPNAGGRMANQGGFSGRAAKPGNVGPIRNDPVRQQRPAPYNTAASVAPIANDIDFADDAPIPSARNFPTGSQIDKWPENNGNFGHPMNRNFDEDMPVDNFNDAPIVINLVTVPKPAASAPVAPRAEPVNQGNFGNNSGGGNDRFQGNEGRFQGRNDRFQGGNDRFQGGNNRFQGNDRFQGNNDRFQGNNDRFQGNNDRFQGNNDRFQGSNDRFQGGNNRFQGGNDRFQGGNDRFQSGNDRFQSGNDRFQSGNDRFQSNGGSSGGGAGNFGNQDRRGFALPENDTPKFGNSQFGGNNSQGNIGGGGGNRNVGFGNNNTGRQQNNPVGGIIGQRRNNTGVFDGNSMPNNNRMQDSNRGGNFGGNINRPMGTGVNTGGGNMNTNTTGFNRNNNMSEGSNQVNLHGPIRNRNMGGAGGGAPNNRNNMGAGGNNNRAMGGNTFGGVGGGGGMGGNNRNMGGNAGNNMNRNMGGGLGGGNQMNPLNFQKDFPALPTGQNMNNRNGPRQNMMSNRRY